jgi:hypothetical protein
MGANGAFLDTCREYGKKRLEIPAKAKSMADWQAMWYDAINPYPFKWGDCWKGNIQYSVDDYDAEVGFWLDMIGLDSNVFSPDFAMLMTPDKVFTFSIVTAGAGGSTPPSAIKIEFMLEGIRSSAVQLESRGVVFEVPVHEDGQGSCLYTGTLRTPHGIAVNLWGVEKPDSAA